jgi:hypothetical protein
MKEITVKMNEDCVILEYGNKSEIIMIEPDVHLSNCVEDTVENRFGKNERLGQIIANECIGLYLGRKYQVVKTETEIINE